MTTAQLLVALKEASPGYRINTDPNAQGLALGPLEATISRSIHGTAVTLQGRLTRTSVPSYPVYFLEPLFW